MTRKSGPPPMCREGSHVYRGRTDRMWPFDGQVCLCGEMKVEIVDKRIRLNVPVVREPASHSEEDQ